MKNVFGRAPIADTFATVRRSVGRSVCVWVCARLLVSVSATVPWISQASNIDCLIALLGPIKCLYENCRQHSANGQRANNFRFNSRCEDFVFRLIAASLCGYVSPIAIILLYWHYCYIIIYIFVLYFIIVILLRADRTRLVRSMMYNFMVSVWDVILRCGVKCLDGGWWMVVVVLLTYVFITKLNHWPTDIYFFILIFLYTANVRRALFVSA